MSDTKALLAGLGVRIPEILLPAPSVDMEAWAVVACDQYSSEKDYWERVARHVDGKPSTLGMIFPECYLEDPDSDERIGRIHAAMEKNLASGALGPRGEAMVLVERRTPYEAEPRIGLVLAVDLEKYRYGKDSDSLVRPTEGTIVERLPPRMRIRRGAPVELPHIMLLLDDPQKTVLEPLYARRTQLRKAYDFDLMMGAGHVRGWLVGEGQEMDRMAGALSALADPGAFRLKYGSDKVLLFAVGDGNHSLATAKAVWEETKKELEGKPGAAALLATHPARYALAELVNIYDPGLPFHPIHRVLFGVDEAKFLSDMAAQGVDIRRMGTAAEAFAACDAPEQGGAHRIAFVTARGTGVLTFGNPESNLAAGSIQTFLDAWLKANPKVGIDYIHGSGSMEALASRPGNLGLYLPPVDKAGFFATVIRDGVMPRKTFSMGEAPEKRFYIEARKIVT